MASSTEGAFPQPARETEAEWRLLLTGVVGRDRTVYGEGPTPTAAIATGASVLVAENVGRTQPVLVTVQATAPGLAAFGRNSGVTLVNGLAHDFASEITFRQILMPNDRLFIFNAGAPNTFIVFKTVV
jgi:hypothetical protein